MAGLAHGEAPTAGNSYVLELDHLRRKCPDAPVEQIAQMAIRKDIDMKHLPWNRRVWRTIEKSEGMVTQMVLNQPRVVFRQTPSRFGQFYTRSEHAGQQRSSPTCSGLPALDLSKSSWQVHPAESTPSRGEKASMKAPVFERWPKAARRP